MLDIRKISIIVSILAIVLGSSVPLLGFANIVNFKNMNVIRKRLEENDSISSVEYNRLVEENDHSFYIIVSLILLTLPAIIALFTYKKNSKIALGLSVASIILLSVNIGLLAHHKLINSNKFTGGIETILLTGTLTQEQFNMVSKEQKGLLIAINILLILVIVIISGVAGYVLYKNNKSGSANITTVPIVEPVENTSGENKYELTNTPF